MRDCIWVQKGIALHEVVCLDALPSICFRFFSDLQEIVAEGQDSRNLIVFRASLLLPEEEILRLPHFQAAALVSTGIDNVDTKALATAEVPFFHFAGQNARAVRDYVVEALLLLYQVKFAEGNSSAFKIAVIGKGHVGSLITAFLQESGLNYLWYDPLLADVPPQNKKEAAHRAYSLQALQDCTVFTFHVPLHKDSPHATYQMLDENYFSGTATSKTDFPYVIQTSRGKIWQPNFYQDMLSLKKVWAQDVYPQEPPLSTWLTEEAFSTPHIAGYSTIGRLQALQLVLKEIFSLLQIQENFSDIFLPLPTSNVWSLQDEAQRLQNDPTSFLARRDNFPWRKELQQYSLDEQKKFLARFASLPQKHPRLFKAVFYT